MYKSRTFCEQKLSSPEQFLRVVEFCVLPAAREKLLMGALLGNAASVDQDDPVGVLHCRKAVRDDERGAAL